MMTRHSLLVAKLILLKTLRESPLVDYVPTINKKNIDSFDKHYITDKVIAFFGGDLEARKEGFDKLKTFLSNSFRFAKHTTRIELMDSLDSFIATIDFRDNLSHVRRYDLIQKGIEKGLVSEFELNSEGSIF